MYLVIKRISDIMISIIGIIMLIPITIIIKILYMLTGDFHTIFYTHKRLGKNGKEFTLYKYRTMVINSDKILKKLLKDKKIKEEYEATYKIKNDIRITKIGKILRKISIDELPQMINVLKGEMSVVGPRPIIKKELKKYKNNKKILLSVRPGLTGNWVIHGRSNITYEQRIEYEIEYITNRSLKMDLKIILKTIILVIKRNGAQ